MIALLLSPGARYMCLGNDFLLHIDRNRAFDPPSVAVLYPGIGPLGMALWHAFLHAEEISVALDQAVQLYRLKATFMRRYLRARSITAFRNHDSI